MEYTVDDFTEMHAKKNEFAMHRHIMVTYIYLGVCSKLGGGRVNWKEAGKYMLYLL